MDQASNQGFSSPRRVTISPAALTMAREFAFDMGRSGRVVAFDWAQSVVVRKPGEPVRNVGGCLMIGAYRRDEVPLEAVDMVDGYALTIHIPDDAWPPGALRLIDVDTTRTFGLTLR